MTYEEIVEKGWGEFDNQSECEDFIRWAIDEIKRLKERNNDLLDQIVDASKGRRF